MRNQPAITTPTFRWFEYEHLPPHIQTASRPFHELAERLLADLEDGNRAELDNALQKLLEAKDAAVRAAITAHERRRMRTAQPESDWPTDD